MSTILDDNLHFEEKDESIINRRTSLFRYLVCGYMIFFLLEEILKELRLLDSSIENITYFLGYLLPQILFVMFVYYNIKQAKVERDSLFVKPFFVRPFIIVFILYTAFLFVIFFVDLISYLIHFRFEISFIITLALTYMLGHIISRELVYYKRVSTFQNNKNIKNHE